MGGFMKVRAITLGCKVNTYESEYILSEFKKKGYEIILTDVDHAYFEVNDYSVYLSEYSVESYQRSHR